MDRFHALQVFVKVAECGGFAAAARELAMSPPAATRAVSALEDRLGVRLLVRTTRSVRLTESGERFLSDCQRILTDMEEAEDAAVGLHTAPRGELRITAPVLFGRLFVTPILGEFLDLHPQVNCQAMFVDRNVNLMDEGLDVAIRIGELPDSSLIAIRAGSVRLVTFAAPEYLREHGSPHHPSELVQHRLAKSQGISSSNQWVFHENGAPVAIRIDPRVEMNTNDAVLEIVRRGWGISRLLSYQVAGHVADGTLQTILTDFEPPAVPIHVLHQEGRMVSSKIRTFVDFMVDRLRANPAIN
jgi:DNA-binding transcriptional LysR family regulator